jgi:radical SAM protein with 4Fe4S-binding SPASM domain
MPSSKFTLEQLGFQEFPRKIMIQTVSRCNGACAFCPYPITAGINTHGMMEESLFQKIIGECAENQAGIDTLMPYLMNEPTLDKKLAEKINYIKERIPYAGVHFLTNGLLLDEDLGNRLIASRLEWIGISYFGNTKETYEASMGLPFELVRKRVDTFVQKAIEKRGADFVMITFFEWKISEAEVRDAVDHWKSLGVKRISHFKKGVSRGGNVALMEAPVNERMTRCDSIWTEEMMHILYNGDVILCCMDWRRQHRLGNVRTQTLKEVWHSEAYQKIRRVMRGIDPLTQENLCRTCEMAKV